MTRYFATFLLLVSAADAAAEYDPPVGYYSSATGVGVELKNQLHDIIDGHTDLGYGGLRTALQVTDEDPDNPGHILLVYDRSSLDLSGIGGSIPGWDNGASWNREHTWPRSRGVGSSGPDNSDLHQHRPSDPQINADRASLNFGGAFGQEYGFVNDGGTKWYPGDADAGMIARQEFYMTVRYDGSDFSTTDLELASGNPGGDQLGDLSRLIEWHFAAPPDEFERRRNQLVYGYQGNRNPFIDRPEYVWSVFVGQANDSQIALQGGVLGGDGGSSLQLDLGRVYVGGAAPQTQDVTLTKSGLDGTYFSATVSGAASSFLAGGFNAFRTGQIDSTQIAVGIDASSATPGEYLGQVVIDNLDVTSGAGMSFGAMDADDVIALEYTVVEHPVASFASDSIVAELSIDLGELAFGAGTISAPVVDLFNYAGAGGPGFASVLELDSVIGSGDTEQLQLGDSLFTGLPQGQGASIDALIDTSMSGDFTSSFQLTLSGEDLPGDQSQVLMLTLSAKVGGDSLQGDFNGDGSVDAADYTVWRDGLNVEFSQQDYVTWRANFGASSATASPASVAPEPVAVTLWASLLAAALTSRYRLALGDSGAIARR
ncbi:Extracellular ribonuclease precursor [Posidoniimonas corsicana]|uniref:Extracellular ribonuclease n=1 Tax=Posidoniimonas corsicana TaxID=1938618 RepID=A0A5C5VI01_9BACT|nr:endonuclease [Posidoniimonas corsicana]TWT37617.1 Extracellular ribonuclease precursor [Posidoniimonas corsicana]